LVVELDMGGPRLTLSPRDGNAAVGDAVIVGVRPEHLAANYAGALTAQIASTEVLGAETVLHARTPSGESLTATMRGILGAKAGETVRFDVADAFAHVFDAAGHTLQPRRAWTDDYLKQLA